MNDYASFYQSIEKPFFAPPEWAFGLAWGIIYPLILVAFVYFVYLLYKKRVPKFLLYVFIANLISNFAFTPIQLSLGSTLFATIDIYLLLATLLYFQYKIVAYSKIIFVLLVPYVLWGAFATVLETSILFLNR